MPNAHGTICRALLLSCLCVLPNILPAQNPHSAKHPQRIVAQFLYVLRIVGVDTPTEGVEVDNFRINSNGTLRPAGVALRIPGANGIVPNVSSMVPDTSGQFLFASVNGIQIRPTSSPAMSGVVSYRVQPQSGELRRVSSVPLTNGEVPLRIAINPAGTLLFAATVEENPRTEETTNRIRTYAISPSGKLTLMNTWVSPNEFSDIGPMVVNPAGTYLYVDEGAGIEQFAISRTTGALSLKETFEDASGTTFNMLFNSTGNLLYRAALLVPASVPAVEPFTVNSTTGSLTSTGAVDCNCAGTGGVIAMNGKATLLFEGAFPDIAMYAIDSTTGLVRALGSSGIRIINLDTFTSAATGSFVYSYDGSSIAESSVNDTGQVTSLGSIPFSGFEGFAVVAVRR